MQRAEWPIYMKLYGWNYGADDIPWSGYNLSELVGKIVIKRCIDINLVNPAVYDFNGSEFVKVGNVEGEYKELANYDCLKVLNPR